MANESRLSDHDSSLLLEAIGDLHAQLVVCSSTRDVFESVLRVATRLVDATSGLYFIADEAIEAMAVAAAVGEPANTLVGTRIPIRGSLSGSVWRNGTAEIVDDVSGAQGVWQPSAMAIHGGSALCVPFGRNEPHAGVVGLGRFPGSKHFRQDDVVLVERFVGIAAGAADVAIRATADVPGHHLANDATIRVVSDPTPVTTSPLTDVPESRVWAMIDSAPDGMIMTDNDGLILVVNRQIEAMFGYDRAELLGRSVDELLPERFRLIHRAHRTRYRVAPKTRSMGAGLELRACRKDGSEFSVEISLSPFADVAGVGVIASIRDVSDRVAAQAHTTRINAAINSTHDGLYVFSADDYRFLHVNEGGIQQTGYDLHELLAMTPMHLSPEFTREALSTLIDPLLRGEVDQLSFRTILRPKDGRDIAIDVVLDVPDREVAPSDRFIVAVVRDVTDRVEAEARLAASEELFRSMFDSAPVGVLIARLDPSGTRIIERANAVFGRMVGRETSDLVGDNLLNFSHPDEIDPSEVTARQFRDLRRNSFADEMRYLRGDGTYGWMLVHAIRLDSPSESGPRVLAHLVDITDRRAAEAESERQRRWMESLTGIRAQLLKGIAVTDALELVCREATLISDADFGAIGVPDVSDTFLELSAQHGFHLERIRIGPAITTVMETRAPVIRERPPDSADVAIVESVGAFMLVPILQESQVLGILVLGRVPDRAPFDDTVLGLVGAIADQAGVALNLARTRETEKRFAVLADRELIARDLHDTAIQHLFATGLGLQAIASAVPSGRAADRIIESINQIDQVIRELRNAIFRVNNPETFTAATRIREATRAYNDQFANPIRLEMSDDVESIPLVVLEQLLPSLTEALANVARHANATTVVVFVGLTDEHAILTVVDNGTGIADHVVHGHGLDNLNARAQRVGGDFTITNNATGTGGATLTWRAKL